jgi:hypothetical protein
MQCFFLKYASILSCEQGFSFFVFWAILTVIWLARIYCILWGIKSIIKLSSNNIVCFVEQLQTFYQRLLNILALRVFWFFFFFFFLRIVWFNTLFPCEYFVVTWHCLISANFDDAWCDCSGCSGELLDGDPNGSDGDSILHAQDLLYCHFSQYQEAWGCQ